MTLTDIARRFGTWALAGFAVCLVTWLLLAALRCPFVFVARLLAAAQGGIDARLTTTLATPTDTSSRRTHHV